MSAAREFVRDRKLVSFPAKEELHVVHTPVFRRHEIPFAAYLSPSPKDPNQVGYYYVTPVSERRFAARAQLRRTRKHLGARKLSGASSAVFHRQLHARRRDSAAADERVVGVLRRLGALLRAADAGARFSEKPGAPLRHAQRPPLARFANHHRRQNPDRQDQLRRSGGLNGARTALSRASKPAAI